MYNLFVLGAGFSVAGGAPKEKNILPEIFSYKKNEKLARNIEKILFPNTSDWINEVSFNEILSRLDLIRYYKPYPNMDYELVESTEQQLIRQMILLMKPEYTKKNQSLYIDFIKGTAQNANFLSFNYDLILEKALAEAGQQANLSLKIINLNHSVQKHKNSEEVKRTLLKLHGSIDLLFCPKCKEIFRVDPANGSDITCPLCISRPSTLQYFLVAPTLYKSYELPAIRDIWFKGLELLINSECICFIGYSLSPEDILTYQMLDTAFRINKGKQRVFLVNGPNYNPQRFINVYGDKLINTKLYFQDWLAGKK